MSPTPTLTILTGAQTGVDTAAILAATHLHIPFAGWVPLGYTNESGAIPHAYRATLRETLSADTAQRTEWNIRDADGVLTILRGREARAVGGTKVGVDGARERGKAMCFVDLDEEWEGQGEKVRRWIVEGGVRVCAVGGPRESEEAGVEAAATSFLVACLAPLSPFPITFPLPIPSTSCKH